MKQTNNSNNNNQDCSAGIVKMLHGLIKQSGPDITIGLLVECA